ILVSADGDFSLSSLKRKGKTILLINNGIHPGEPDGIDASMLLVRDIVTGGYRLPSSVVLAIIPVYNIGGALNRSMDYRVDQNGPEAFGFRGNSQNLDLNRDFIKADSKEALSFSRLFQRLDPDLFIDNHVSNGADYQHIMTLLTTQHHKLGGPMGRLLHQQMEPSVYERMKVKGYDLIPYVNHSSATPDKGWTAFWDAPRYSSGYATLWHSFAFVPETHMLKPYPQRVASTRSLMESFIEYAGQNGTAIARARREQRAWLEASDSLTIRWRHDRTKADTISFRGYAPEQRTSGVSGLSRLFYNRSQPLNVQVPFYNTYTDSVRIRKPRAYVLPQGWWKVAERLQANGIPMTRLSRDTTIEVEYYRVEKTTPLTRPFEGHFLHTGVQVVPHTARISFQKGDYLIPVRGNATRFLLETLEPHAEDSYFAWNFFDPILGQKEGFSDYAFEETAAGLLEQDPALKAKLEERRHTDSAFARNANAQLDFIYRNSRHYEPAHLRYPVYRITGR
ncbi:MAG TPA: hypothetical protein VHK69_13805, partial [Chitinophagaceae bacterium]|nr:hypothetical protein [Chitinophagaceae bacterium]